LAAWAASLGLRATLATVASCCHVLKTCKKGSSTPWRANASRHSSTWRE
jgi:hypothetical protein